VWIEGMLKCCRFNKKSHLGRNASEMTIDALCSERGASSDQDRSMRRALCPKNEDDGCWCSLFGDEEEERRRVRTVKIERFDKHVLIGLLSSVKLYVLMIFDVYFLFLYDFYSFTVF